MAEGKGTWEGVGLPLLGEYEQQQQNPTLDVVTLTGSTGQTGDFMVAQDSDGTEVFAISSSGNVTMKGYGVSSTIAVSAVNVAVTSTGANAQGASNAAFMVTGSSKSALNACYGYTSAEGPAPTAFLLTSGSSIPAHFLTFGATASGVAAASDIGFFDSAHKLTALATTTIFGVIKILSGSKCYHMLCIPDTGTVAQ